MLTSISFSISNRYDALLSVPLRGQISKETFVHSVYVTKLKFKQFIGIWFDFNSLFHKHLWNESIEITQTFKTQMAVLHELFLQKEEFYARCSEIFRTKTSQTSFKCLNLWNLNKKYQIFKPLITNCCVFRQWKRFWAIILFSNKDENRKPTNLQINIRVSNNALIFCSLE